MAVDPLVWFVVAGGLLVLVVIVALLRGRSRRRRALQEAAARAQVAAPPRPSKDLLDLALKQREEAIIERRRQMEAAAAAVNDQPAPVPTLPSVRKAAVLEEPPLDIVPEPSEPAINPVQKMALDQWDDVNVVSPASRPKPVPLRPKEEPLEFAAPSKGKTGPRPEDEPMEYEVRQRPKAAPLRPKQEPEFELRPNVKKKKDPILDADWGDIEVRRDVKER